MDQTAYRNEIEKQVLEVMGQKLQGGEMGVERAQEIARYILQSLQPHLTPEQIRAVAENFNDHFAELMPIVIRIKNEYEQQTKQAVVGHVERLIKEGRVAEANTLLGGVNK